MEIFERIRQINLFPQSEIILAFSEMINRCCRYVRCDLHTLASTKDYQICWYICVVKHRQNSTCLMNDS